MYQNYVIFLKRVTRFTPLQFLGQSTVKTDHSQFLKFAAPLFGFLEKYIVLRIHFIHLLQNPSVIIKAPPAIQNKTVALVEDVMRLAALFFISRLWRRGKVVAEKHLNWDNDHER